MKKEKMIRMLAAQLFCQQMMKELTGKHTHQVLELLGHDDCDRAKFNIAKECLERAEEALRYVERPLMSDRTPGKLYVALRMDCHERGHYTGPSDVHLLGCFTSEDLARDACRQAGLNMASLSPEDDEVWGPGLARIIEITPDTSMDEWLA